MFRLQYSILRSFRIVIHSQTELGECGGLALLPQCTSSTYKRSFVNWCLFDFQ